MLTSFATFSEWRSSSILTSRKSLHILIREEEVVEEQLHIVTTKLQAEHLLVVDVVHQVGHDLRIGDDDRDEHHVALRGFRVGDLNAILVESCEAVEVREGHLGDWTSGS